MRYDLTSMELFIAVAEERNVTRAARRCHLAVSALSKRIAELETQAGAPLINSIGNLGGFVGPFMIGMVKRNGNNATQGLLFLAALVAVAFVMTLLIRVANTSEPQPAQPLMQAKER